ncbi:hypothetical protein StoSoilB13_28140 (plasmid) [Arthrobacter sp. StoSoilB13]|nr:hypothetical protein StoSoilB13_28140 [Arthrobacter sp. StoSoilB13]
MGGRRHAVVHLHDPGAQAVGEIEVMRGDQDGRAGVRQCEQGGRDSCAGLRIEPTGGLINKEDLGIIGGLQGDGEDTALSGRQVPRVLVSYRNPDVTTQSGQACRCRF